MAKLIKKSKCKFENGVIVKKSKVIGIPRVVWLQLNSLELMSQQYDYLATQPEACEGPSLKGFKRKSALRAKRPYAMVEETPVTDRRVKEAMEFMAEQDCIANAELANEYVDRFGALVDWLDGDKFVEGECFTPIDTPTLGNPLKLTPEDVTKILLLIVSSPIRLEG